MAGTYQPQEVVLTVWVDLEVVECLEALVIDLEAEVVECLLVVETEAFGVEVVEVERMEVMEVLMVVVEEEDAVLPLALLSVTVEMLECMEVEVLLLLEVMGLNHYFMAQMGNTQI